MACNRKKFVGRDVVLEYHIGCGDVLPLESEWKRFGSMRTKSFEISWDTIDATDDESIGSLRENLALFQTLTMSGDGTVKVSTGGAANLTEITKHVARPDATGGQPTAWMRMTFPDLTFIAYMLIPTMGRSAPYDDVVTYTLEASATASDFGLIIEDTPNPNAPAPTSVDLVPATLSITQGQAYDLEAVVLPAGSSQRLRWTSSDPGVAKVDATTGLVTAVAGGTATITAASAENSAINDTCSVTVVPLAQGITVSPASVSIADGATQQLTASVYPAGAASGLTYTSAAPAVATVSGSGLVTGVEPGSTTVTITSTARPSVKVIVPVTVTE